ncbi:MAG: hypothetical protein OJI70_07205 [Zavarzinia sp.]|nr:hypothetical protein [Zavarzinia sp.]
MKISKKFPLHQGDLDYFCSIYAALNLIHLKGKLDSVKEAEKLFRKIINEINKDETGDIVRYITEGNYKRDVPWLLDLIKYNSGDKLTKKTDIIEKFGNKEEVYKFFNEDFPAFVYIVREDGFTHYTVIKGVGENGGFSLFDSYGFSEISFGDDGLMLDGVFIRKLQVWPARSNAN